MRRRPNRLRGLAALGTVEDESDEWDSLSPRQRRHFSTARDFMEAKKDYDNLRRQLRTMASREDDAWAQAGKKGNAPASPERRRLKPIVEAARVREMLLASKFSAQYGRPPPGYRRARPDQDEEEFDLNGLAALKAPKTGPMDATLANGEKLSLFYMRESRMWVLQLLDANNDQIGPGYDGTAEYIHSRSEAGEEFDKLARERGGIKKRGLDGISTRKKKLAGAVENYGIELRFEEGDWEQSGTHWVNAYLPSGDRIGKLLYGPCRGESRNAGKWRSPILDVVIAPKYRGMGLYPAMLSALRDKVRQDKQCAGLFSDGDSREPAATASWEKFAEREPRVSRRGGNYYLDGLAANGQRGGSALSLATIALVGIGAFVLWKLLSSGESETGERETVGTGPCRDIDSQLATPIGCGTAAVTGYVGGKGSPITIREIPGAPGYYLQSSPVDVWSAFQRLRDAAVNAGHAVTVNSAFRTMAKQSALYAAYTAGTGNKAARPGYSKHQNGTAIDLAVKQGSLLSWLRSSASAYGFFETVLGENWHWEYDPARDRYARIA